METVGLASELLFLESLKQVGRVRDDPFYENVLKVRASHRRLLFGLVYCAHVLSIPRSSFTTASR